MSKKRVWRQLMPGVFYGGTYEQYRKLKGGIMLTSGKAKAQGTLTVESAKPGEILVPFMLHVRSKGKLIDYSKMMDHETGLLAMRIIERGYRFTIEVLSGWSVAITCEREPKPGEAPEVVSTVKGTVFMDAFRDLLNRSWDALGGSHGK